MKNLNIEKVYESLVRFAYSYEKTFNKFSASDQRAKFGFAIFGKKTVHPIRFENGDIWFELRINTMTGDYDSVSYSVRQCAYAVKHSIKLGRGCGIPNHNEIDLSTL